MKIVSKFAAVLISTATLLIASQAQAQFAKPDDAIKYRQAAFNVMGTHFGRIGAMVQDKVPFDAKVAQANMAVVDAVHKLPHDAFVAGSDTSTKVGAPRPEVWTQKDKFAAARDKNFAEIAKLSAAVKSGDLGQIKAAFGGAGGSCKSCHDDFRVK
jgi:cytochrome c556